MPNPLYILAREGRVLDPRPSKDSQAQPLSGAVNIPFDELKERLHELPPKNEVVRVAAGFPSSAPTVHWLISGRRKAELTDARVAEAGQQPLRIWKPSEFLRSVEPHLQIGFALDMGCGSGREAVALAASGFRVTACDILADALAKGQKLAERYLTPSPQPELPIRWVEWNIESAGITGGPYDLVVSFRFLHRPLLKIMDKFLKPGGSLLLETFTSLHRERHGKPSSDHHVLFPGELATLTPGLSVRIAEEGWHGENHMGRLWAVKE